MRNLTPLTKLIKFQSVSTTFLTIFLLNSKEQKYKSKFWWIFSSKYSSNSQNYIEKIEKLEKCQGKEILELEDLKIIAAATSDLGSEIYKKMILTNREERLKKMKESELEDYINLCLDISEFINTKWKEYLEMVLKDAKIDQKIWKKSLRENNLDDTNLANEVVPLNKILRISLRGKENSEKRSMDLEEYKKLMRFQLNYLEKVTPEVKILFSEPIDYEMLYTAMRFFLKDACFINFGLYNEDYDDYDFGDDKEVFWIQQQIGGFFTKILNGRV